MGIITLQRRMRELGRIRTGIQVASKGGGRRPEKLETFRITSDAQGLVEAAAEAYGGKAQPWDNNGHPEFEVITEATTLDIVIPPGQAISQFFEMWGAGGCLRRCDGVTNLLTMTPCACPDDVQERTARAAKGEACKPTTRLSVMLPQIPDLGCWRLESHGFYAAVELAGAADVLEQATAAGVLIPARLRLDQREKKVPGKPTNRYAVPVIEFHRTRMADLIAEGSVEVAGGPRQVGPGDKPARPALPAGPELPARSDFRAPGKVGQASQEALDEADEHAPSGADISFAAPALTTAAFMQLLGAATERGATNEIVAAAGAELYPGRRLPDLTDAERARLWAVIDQRLEQVPA